MKRKVQKRLIEADKRFIWHPFTQMQEWFKEDPLVIERGEGNYLIDTEGRRYIDANSSLWTNIHGHRNRTIERSIREQLGKIAHSTLLGLSNVPSIELAEKLAEITPGRLKRVFYSDNGSTAVEAALKIAFQYWRQTPGGGKKKAFLSFTGAYHGDTTGAMSVGEIDVFVERFSPLLFPVFRSTYPYCYRCPLKKSHPECALACLDELEDILKRHHEEIAACIIEPLVQGAAGMVTSPPGFLRGVRRLTKKYNVLLIADEVATGFGRTGRMFACEHEDVAPDIICLAKGITGGYLPLAATITTEKIFRAFLGRYDRFRAFFHGHTYTGNQLACAAALANIEVFEKERVIERIQPKIRLLQRELEPFRELKHVGDVRQRGLMAGIELVEDRESKKPFAPGRRVAYRLCMEARKGGIITRPLGDTIVIMPPLSIKPKEIRTITRVLFELVKAL